MSYYTTYAKLHNICKTTHKYKCTLSPHRRRSHTIITILAVVNWSRKWMIWGLRKILCFPSNSFCSRLCVHVGYLFSFSLLRLCSFSLLRLCSLAYALTATFVLHAWREIKIFSHVLQKLVRDLFKSMLHIVFGRILLSKSIYYV
jgi:hypothetical protein